MGGFFVFPPRLVKSNFRLDLLCVILKVLTLLQDQFLHIEKRELIVSAQIL